MKYSSGMKECHSDILKALRVMCENDGNLVEMVPPDNSPLAPLISYFKRVYANKAHSNGKLAYSCKSTKGVVIDFKRAIHQSGATIIEMTWMQVAKFIRDNRDEFFEEEENEPKTKALELLVKTFDEKEITCPNWVTGKTLTYRELLNGVHFECKALSTEFGKLEDITRFFAQHCNCHDKCPYYQKRAAEKQSSPAAEDLAEAHKLLENQLSYIDKLREKYPKVKETDEWFNGVYCPGYLFSGDKLPGYKNDWCSLNPEGKMLCQECWTSPCAADVAFRETYEEDFETGYYSHYPEEAPAEADKPKPTYKDVLLEHYPNFDERRFEAFAFCTCITDYFDSGANDCTNHDNCKNHWESQCESNWNPCSEADDYIKKYLVLAKDTATEKSGDEPPKKMSKMCQELFASNADTDTQTATNPPVPANAEEIASTFNYAVLSTEMGDYLKHKEQQLKNEYMNFTANCGAIFAEAQEKLAGDNHYNGLFLKWIESMGFKKSAVYRMIDVHKFYSSQIGKSKQELFAELPKSLQYEISAKSAPPELVEQVLNGDITTHAEYIKLKKELERTQEECRMIDANSAAKDKEYQRQIDEANRRAETERKARESISENYTSLQEGYKDYKDKYTEEYYKNVELKKHIEELKKQPVDVVVQQDEKALAEKEAEIQRLKDELEKSRRDSLDDCFEKPGEIPTREILEFYETLQANAISAIKECARFIKDKIPNNLQGDAKSRFNMLEELLADCKQEMEE